MAPDEARALMHEWVANLALRTHMECVALCMASYADKLAPTERERWVVCGLLHDFDYERHPTREEHPFVGVKLLESLGVDEDIRAAILGHATYSNVPRETPMAKVLFAVDELAGFLVACSKVRPDGFATLNPKSVAKKLKQASFAAAVNRDEIRKGMEELGVEFDPHVQQCIEAIRPESARLGL